MPATSIVDAIGTVINVGATVKLVGVVTAINAFDAHFGECVVTLNNPAGIPVTNISLVNDIAGGVPSPTLACTTVNVAPKMLLVGA
jgi:hypothetical protein